MKRLNIIGCGKLGQSIARLWHDAKVFETGSILNQTPESSEKAVAHIGSGQVCSQLSEAAPADLWLIATNDQSISVISEQLSACQVLRPADTVFHCSGALSSDVLTDCKNARAYIASVHPVMSFASPLSDEKDFNGVFCGAEGDNDALKLIEPAFESIGGKCFRITSEHKTLYHAATVMCCNYLTALTEASSQLFQQAGLDAPISQQLMQPIMETTLANIFQHGTTSALTGPIARGDVQTVSQHLEAMESSATRDIYQSLGKVALKLSQQQGFADSVEIEAIAELLRK